MLSRALSYVSVLSALALAACASRPLHPEFPSSSAASPDEVAPPPDAVAVSLEADPPLPGEPTEGWLGLEPEPGSSGHAHHGHGHDHGR
jgi:hypothetical protein